MRQYNPERYVRWQVRKAVLERDKACTYCGLSVARIVGEDGFGANSCWRAYDQYGRPFHFDHKLPFSQGGASGETNIVLACCDCNWKKGVREHPRAERKFDPRQGRLALIFAGERG